MVTKYSYSSNVIVLKYDMSISIVSYFIYLYFGSPVLHYTYVATQLTSYFVDIDYQYKILLN